MSAWQVAARCLLAAMVVWAHAPSAVAHEMSLAEMSVREVTAGQFVWAWGVPAKNKPIAEDLTPIWPQGCTADARTVRCGEKGLTGELSVQGVGKAYSAAIVRINWRSGEPQVYTLTSTQPKVQLYGGAADPRGPGAIAWAYGALGIEHILTGFDHLLFVLSLLFLVGFKRQLIGTITAFTLAHSITLASSALGLLVLRSPPVEACIALSILLVSAEALSKRDSWTRQRPALVAFLFGLVHGLGFAGALKEIGLPEQHVSVALLTFNVGVELGQLLVVGLAWAASYVFTRYIRLPQARRVTLYGIGAMAAYWSINRVAALLG